MTLVLLLVSLKPHSYIFWPGMNWPVSCVPELFSALLFFFPVAPVACTWNRSLFGFSIIACEHCASQQGAVLDKRADLLQNQSHYIKNTGLNIINKQILQYWSTINPKSNLLLWYMALSLKSCWKKGSKLKMNWTGSVQCLLTLPASIEPKQYFWNVLDMLLCSSAVGLKDSRV